jgi:hypothetical protein
MSGVGLFVVRRDLVERITLVCAVIAAGSSALYGVGIRSPALSAVRLCFHFAGYSMAAVAFVRMFQVVDGRRRGGRSE